MAIHIRDPRTDQAVRRLAARKGLSLTDAIREACEAELARERERIPSAERLKAIQERVRALPDTGLKADKAFFDRLSGDG